MAFYQMIHHDKKFIALFSPKCACTTLKAWFAKSLEQGETDDEQQLNVHRMSVHAIADYPGYQKLLFVRSPYDRLVSFYCSFIVDYVELWGFADADKQVGLRGTTFSEFVRVLQGLSLEAVRFQHHLEPQLMGLDSLIPDRVVRVDDLDRELPIISRELGFDYVPKRLNPMRNIGDHSEPAFDQAPEKLRAIGMPHYRYFYNDELLGIVADIYATDLACYGFAPRENPYLQDEKNDLRNA